MASQAFPTTLKVTIGKLRTAERAIKALEAEGIIVPFRTVELLRAIPYEQKPRVVPLTYVTGNQLGQYGLEELWRIFERGRGNRLHQILGEVAPALWLQHSELVMSLPKARLVMPVEYPDGPERLFLIRHQKVGDHKYRYLDTDFGDSNRKMYGRYCWIFGTRRTIFT